MIPIIIKTTASHTAAKCIKFNNILYKLYYILKNLKNCKSQKLIKSEFFN
jgi:hypothetical protein